MTTAALIVAAGRGTRAGGPLPKQWQPLGPHRVIDETIAAFQRAGVTRILLVLHPDDMARAPLPAVPGGATRAASVRAGLEALAADPPQNVLIHDGARPLVSPEIIQGVLKALESGPAAAPALPVTDALWRGETHVTGTEDRTHLWRAQTPQGFHFAAILAAHQTLPKGTEPADDVAVARLAGFPVTITPGEERNLKITAPEDFTRAVHYLKDSSMDTRLGNGYDVHRFGPGDQVTLCGITLPHNRSLQGHSDADVGMHALTDAIYGALAEGDIGRHFPPSDPQWKGADSSLFLSHAAGRIRARGFTLANADVTLVCEQPKIGPHAEAMAHRLAEIMSADPTRISVKATTSERLGFTGREEGIAALATCALMAL